MTVLAIYKAYAEYIGKHFTIPKYKYSLPIPFIPTETEIDSLIAAGTQRTATLLQLLKETGARIGEVNRLKWIDVDTERRTISINSPEKGSNSRVIPITAKLSEMLKALPKINDKVFQAHPHAQRVNFEYLRDTTAKKLNNPRLKNIHFHTFRHFKGTMEYHKTKDIIHVKQILGHRSIQSTMTYINIEQALFLQTTDEWTCKTAKTVQEAAQLIEAGFEKMDEIDGIKLYRKRK